MEKCMRMRLMGKGRNIDEGKVMLRPAEREQEGRQLV